MCSTTGKHIRILNVDLLGVELPVLALRGLFERGVSSNCKAVDDDDFLSIIVRDMDSSVLFSGLRFDKNRFGTDVRRFKRGVARTSGVHAVSVNGLSGEDAPTTRDTPTEESVEGTRNAAKKNVSDSSTRNGSGASFSFNVFQPVPGIHPTDDVPKEISVSKQNRKSKARLEEEVGALRKKFRLHVTGQSVPPPLRGFEQLRPHCKKLLLKRISEAGYSEPTPIQRQAIPVLLSRRECLACAPTGSGKTLAFMLPIVMNLQVCSSERIRAVILCPIRELAAQISREFRTLVLGKKLRVRVLTTALFKNADFSTLPCDVLITTPLRLEHLIKDKKIDLRSVEYLVMDESDKLFEMGFVEQIDSIVAACSNPQVVRALFSATLPDTVEELSRTIMLDPIRIVVGEKNSATSTVDQKLLYVGSEDGKLLALKQIFRKSLCPPILLFVDSKERAKELHRELAFDDVNVDSIHSDRTQEQRNVAVDKFREGKTWVLIATDLMARGMDFKGVNCVINYDFPRSTATYIHRIGRSGRAGRSGEAVTFYTEKDVPYLRSTAHVIRGAGCEVPEWMLSLRKLKPKKRKR